LSHSSSPFCAGGFSNYFFPHWLQIKSLLISASQEAGITGVSHGCPTSQRFGIANRCLWLCSHDIQWLELIIFDKLGTGVFAMKDFCHSHPRELPPRSNGDSALGIQLWWDPNTCSASSSSYRLLAFTVIMIERLLASPLPWP
jgi:hypothetical protein